MRQQKLLLMVLFSFMCYPLFAQGFLEGILKTAGEAATERAKKEVESFISGEDNDSRSSGRITGFKVVCPSPDLDIQVKRCVAVAGTVTIDLVLTNYGKDTELILSGGLGGSEAFDDEGNSYSGGAFGAGSVDVGVNSGKKTLSLPYDVPIKARIVIEGIPESAQILKRINLKAYSKELGIRWEKNIIFHNIPINWM